MKKISRVPESLGLLSKVHGMEGLFRGHPEGAVSIGSASVRDPTLSLQFPDKKNFKRQRTILQHFCMQLAPWHGLGYSHAR